jgi:hypothetical protein
MAFTEDESMFDPVPQDSTVLTFRVRKPMERDIKREAKKRKLKVSEEVRRRLDFYAAHHAEKPVSASAK